MSFSKLTTCSNTCLYSLSQYITITDDYLKNLIVSVLVPSTNGHPYNIAAISAFGGIRSKILWYLILLTSPSIYEVLLKRLNIFKQVRHFQVSLLPYVFTNQEDLRGFDDVILDCRKQWSTLTDMFWPMSSHLMGVLGKWTSIVLFQSTDCSKHLTAIDTFTHSHTHSYSVGRDCHARCRPSHQEKVGGQCLAQGRLSCSRGSWGFEPIAARLTLPPELQPHNE